MYPVFHTLHSIKFSDFVSIISIVTVEHMINNDVCMHQSMASLSMVTNSHLKLIETVKLCTKLKQQKLILKTSINVNINGKTTHFNFCGAGLLSSLNHHMATGPDNIPAYFLKEYQN